MDEATLREHVQKHADAAVRGDMDALTADFSEELRPQLPQLAQALPQRITNVETLSIDMGDPVSVAVVRYSGSSGGVTIRQNWEDHDGRPVIVHAEPVS